MRQIPGLQVTGLQAPSTPWTFSDVLNSHFRSQLLAVLKELHLTRLAAALHALAEGLLLKREYGQAFLPAAFLEVCGQHIVFGKFVCSGFKDSCLCCWRPKGPDILDGLGHDGVGCKVSVWALRCSALRV